MMKVVRPNDLSALWRKSSSSLVACRGRRRIGKLFKEFDEMFSAVFGDAALAKRAILAALANGPKSGAELANELGMANTGRYDGMLDPQLAGGGYFAASVNAATLLNRF